MSKKERDTLEDLFHAKLYDHEVDTTPEDWEMIMSRLPESKPVTRTLNRRWWYGAAAAIAALTMTTTVLFLADKQQPDTGISQTTKDTPFIPETENKKDTTATKDITDEIPSSIVASAVIPQQQTTSGSPVRSSRQAATARTFTATAPTEGEIPTVTTVETPVITQEPDTNEENITEQQDITTLSQTKASNLIADAEPVSSKSTPKKQRRWGIGMGGGSLTASADNSFNTLVQHSAYYQEDRQLLMANTIARSPDTETNIRYKTPVSFGLSASYALNNRWSLMAGLSYSMLITEFDQVATYRNEVRTKLHFVGLPISIAYNIAEWNSFRLYAATGFMPELNVAGKNRIREYAGDELKKTTVEDARIKKMFWSVNARAGISYPVVRYVNAFAEVGASYYFDNNSDIKTIHSEKPFNVAFNFGLRLGF